jgi:DNA (cytosine-5)-methyltransferase 1
MLDLFCGAGGCAAGYARAGFEVHGVDNKPQPRYLASGAARFTQVDALEYLAEHGHEYDAIHASPPCQAYSRARHCPGSAGREYPDLLGASFAALQGVGLPWVVENVPGAPMLFPVVLCGTQFGLRVRRHRLFSSSALLLGPGDPCRHRSGDLTVFGNCVQVTGSRGVPYTASSGRRHYRPLRASSDAGRAAMGISWMNRAELSQAIPPAYTEYLGRQLIAYLEGQP